MSESWTRLPVRMAAVLTLCAVVAGCGVRGEPELPPVKTVTEDGKTVETPGKADTTNKPFILDGLL